MTTTAEISSTELKSQLDNGAPLVLLETLSEAHYQRGHLPGALLLPHTEVRERASQVVPDKASQIIVYCANRACRNSHLAAGVLQALGYPHVRIFAGGKEEWREAGFAFEA